MIKKLPSRDEIADMISEDINEAKIENSHSLVTLEMTLDVEDDFKEIEKILMDSLFVLRIEPISGGMRIVMTGPVQGTWNGAKIIKDVLTRGGIEIEQWGEKTRPPRHSEGGPG